MSAQSFRTCGRSNSRRRIFGKNAGGALFLQTVTWVLIIILSVPSALARDIFVNLTYVGPSDGTSAKPFRTFKEAYQIAQAGDTIQLQAGKYSEGGRFNLPIHLKSQGGIARIGEPGPTPSEDVDSDGMADSWELAFGLSPRDPNDANLDLDLDGFPNLEEFQRGSDPTSAENTAGSLPGQVAVSSAGAGTYAFAIAVPPGTGGMEPKLSVSYSSRSGNGLLGVGFSISGISSITRCGATKALDEFDGSVKFNSRDRFCLDGQRLIAIRGIYGADGTEYRTESDTFTRVISYGQAGSGPAFFRAWSRGGQVVEYAATPDSRVEAVAASGGDLTDSVPFPENTVVIWSVNRITDTKGNFINYGYSEDSKTGEYYPNRIDYTGNATTGLVPFASIVFNYEDRQDRSLAFQFGARTESRRRLSHIRTFASDQLVNSYAFEFEYGSATGRSRLRSVQISDAKGNTLPKTTFSGWTDSKERGRFSIRPQFRPANYDISDNNYRFAEGDFNGDGKADLVHFVNNKGVRVWFSQGNGSFEIADSFPNSDYAVSSNDYRFYTGDFNGDGKTDLAHFVSARFGYIWLSKGDGTFTIRSGLQRDGYDLSDNDYRFQTGDFDGDGRTDFVHFSGPHSTRVWLSNGDGSFDVRNRFDPGYDYSYNNYRISVIDANGDGRSDLLHFANDNYVRAWFSQGDGTFDVQGRFPKDDSYRVSANNYAFTLRMLNVPSPRPSQIRTESRSTKWSISTMLTAFAFGHPKETAPLP